MADGVFETKRAGHDVRRRNFLGLVQQYRTSPVERPLGLEGLGNSALELLGDLDGYRGTAASRPAWMQIGSLIATPRMEL